MMDAKESKDDYKDSAKRWLDALRIAGKNQEMWEERSRKIEERYRDDDRNENSESKRFNILWSNIETLRPAVYSRTPKPVVVRRFKDSDPIAKNASIVLERALEYSIDVYDFDEVMRAVVEDRLLSGRGVARIIYDPTIIQNQGVDGEEYEEVAYEEVQCEYVYWKDFRHGSARKWSQVPWVAFRTYPTRDELKARFGNNKASRIPLNYKPEGCDDDDSQFKKAKVWEIWSKTDKKIYWVAEDFDEVLDEDDPYINLHGFFPCPKPLYATTTNSHLIPVPDYVEYQDQAAEMDALTARINSLVESVKISGVYAADAPEIKTMLESADESPLIPVANWAMFAERGGLDGMVSWFPLDQIVSTIVNLYEAREKTKQELYEITGLADIIRGSSQSNETATAQRIKGQFATLRLSDTQEQVAKFAKDLIALKAEVIAEHFSPQSLQLMTGMQIDPQVIELLKSDQLRRFRVDIETDSTINIDEQADKESRVEFLNTASSFLERAIPAYQSMPELGELLGQMLMFGIRGFRAGRELEDSFEQAMQKIGQRPQQPQTNPEAEAKAAKMQQDMQISEAKAKNDIQISTAKTQQELMQSKQKHELDMQKGMMDMQKKQMEAEMSYASLPMQV
jgi:hypothetical protein